MRKTAIVFATVVLSLLAVSCSRTEGKDLLLSEFDEVVCLEPSDSVDLEKYGILMPESVDVYGDWFVIRKTGGENNIVLLNPGTGESIGCFKTGRGPGEVINIGSVQILGDSLYVYDVSRAETSVLDLGASIRERRQVLVRAAPESFSGGALLRPFRLYRYPGGVMVAGLFDDGTWYASFDGGGEECGRILQIEYGGTEGMTSVEKSSFHLSSTFSVRPDGGKAVCAMSVGGAFSIADIGPDGTVETVRKVYYAPQLSRSEGGRAVSPSYSPENRRAFCGAASDEGSIYLLYSGKSASDGAGPQYQCRHLLVYDWEGNPVRRYELSAELNSFCLTGTTVYGVSSYPSGRLYRYELPDGCIIP